MKVVVLLSAYNGEKYIKEQIDSILDQTRVYKDVNNNEKRFELEIIVRDDGSKDDTVSILEAYNNQEKISFYTGKNVGSANSFFDLIVKAPLADYYALSDQDDYWLPNKVSNAISMLESQEVSKKTLKLYGSNAKLVDQELKPLRTNFYPKVISPEFKLVSCSCGLLGCTMIFNDSIVSTIREHGVPHKAIMHDFYITLLCCSLNGIIIYDESAEILYRQHGKNVYGANTSVKTKVITHFRSLKDETPSISICDQSREMLEMYGAEIDEGKRKWLTKVSVYRQSFINRLFLACSVKYHFYSLRRAIPMRLRILLGKI